MNAVFTLLSLEVSEEYVYATLSEQITPSFYFRVPNKRGGGGENNRGVGNGSI